MNFDLQAAVSNNSMPKISPRCLMSKLPIAIELETVNEENESEKIKKENSMMEEIFEMIE